MTRLLVLPHATPQPSTRGPAPKKSCSGTCDRCKSKRVKHPVEPAPAEVEESGEPEPFASMHETVNENEMRGVEFDGQPHRQHWNGLFAGTADF